MTNEQTENEEESTEFRRRAAAAMGRVRSQRKTEAVRKNGLLGGKQIKPIMTIECKCGSPVLLREDGTPAHPTTCPRGRVIRWRQKKGLPLT